MVPEPIYGHLMRDIIIVTGLLFQSVPGEGAGLLNKVVYREAPHRGLTPTLLYHWKMVPLYAYLLDN